MKVLSFGDGSPAGTLTWGNDWLVGGVNLFGTAQAGVDWTISEVGLMNVGSDPSTYLMICAFAEDGTLLTASPNPAYGPETPGTYENALLRIVAQKDGGDPVNLDIPITLVVEE